MKKQNSQQRNSRNSHRKLIGSIVLVIIIGAGLLAWWSHHSSQATARVQTAVSKQPGTKTSSQIQHDALSSPTPTPNPDVPGGTTGSNVGSAASVTAPSGQFVNNHGSDAGHPVQSATQESSSCTTTPGATCVIQFSKDGVTKSLPSQSAAASKVSPGGTTTWTWTPGDLGLTSGNWTVTAVATLNGQSKSTTDSIKLTVSP